MKTFAVAPGLKVDVPYEISMVTPFKIEGVSEWWPPESKFNCEACRFDRSAVKGHFTWIPADE